MDFALLKTEIQTGPLAAELAPLVDANDDAGVAAVLNDRRSKRIVERHVNAKVLMSELGAGPGATFMGKLETLAASVPSVKYALDFLRTDSGVNVADPQTRGMLDQFALA